ncbi:MAG: hypothetical protein KAS11_03870, partial [Candidatus Aenigmarchaeota archaeon]|nr:hypothetical protein [Candidatus Aenigmarchaeota archaeon]
AGKAGTCKTTVSASFIYDGVQKNEPGVYITTEEMEDGIKNDLMSVFGWDFAALEQKGVLNFMSIKPIYPDKVLGDSDLAKISKFYTYDISKKIIAAVRAVGAKRLVIDSISIFEMFIKDKYLAKISLMTLLEELRKTGVTTVITGEIPESSEGLSRNEIVEYLADGVMKLEFVPVSEDYKRTITIRKMRRTNHSSDIHPFEFNKTGLNIVEVR